ncbi:hypothetical protein Taro_028107, partial [Colocasia esculenta]|nr:hypothetical protein [Colocasia esculenta]
MVAMPWVDALTGETEDEPYTQEDGNDLEKHIIHITRAFHGSNHGKSPYLREEREEQSSYDVSSAPRSVLAVETRQANH